LYSNIAGSPTRTVPGTALLFASGTSIVDGFTIMACAPGGDRWAIRARAVPSGGGSATDLVVSATLDQTTFTAGARVILRTTEVSYQGGRLWESIGSSLGINDAGQVAIPVNLSGPTSDDELVTRWTPSGGGGGGGTWTTIAQEGIAALLQPIGVQYGPVLRSVHILPDGTTGLQASVLVNAPASQLLLHLTAPGLGTLLASNTTTTPSGQLAFPNQLLTQFFAERCITGNAGGGGGGTSTVAWYVGRLNGSTISDQVMVRGNTVLAQEGFIKPGSGFLAPVSDLSLMPVPSAAHQSSVGSGGPGGEGLYFGSNADGLDWVSTWSTSGQTIVAQTGGLIAPGETRVWSDTIQALTFLGGAINPSNVWVVAGRTSGLASTDTAIVHETAGVILREGDGVDLNGDGFANDNVFVADIATSSVQFGSNGRVYMIALLRNAAGNILGSGIVRLLTPIGNVCDSIDFNNDGSFFDPTDIDSLLSVFSEGPCVPAGATCNDIDFNNDGSLFDPADIDSFLSVFSEGPCL